MEVLLIKRGWLVNLAWVLGPAVSFAVPSSGAAAAGIRVVVVPSLERVFRDQVGLAGDDSVRISCARGETESCQVVVINEGKDALHAMDLEWSMPTTQDGRYPRLNFFRVHYVQVKEPSHRMPPRLGWYPDGLIPFEDPYTGLPPSKARYQARGQGLSPGECQPYWLDVIVPRDAKPGTYAGEIRVLARGFRRHLDLVLTVWDFDLPVAPSLPTRFGLSDGGIRDAYGLPLGDARVRLLRERHERVMAEHRLTVLGAPAVPFESTTGEARVDATYLAKLRVFVDRYKPPMCLFPATENWPFPDPFGVNRAKFTRYLQSIDRMIRAHPWIPPAIIYPIDEPGTPEEYQKVRVLGEILHSNKLAIKSLVTGELRPKPGWPPLDDAIDIWVYAWKRWNPDAVAERRKRRQSVWAYNATGPEKRRVPVWLLDADVVEYMVPFWIAWNLDLGGLLYWGMTVYGPTRDPWREPMTYKAGGKYPVNGEACLIYPGGAVGVVGPVPCIRLKIIRDGLDCYDYLKILADRAGRKEADRIAGRLAPSFFQWDRDWKNYLSARQQVAEAILKNAPSRRD